MRAFRQINKTGLTRKSLLFGFCFGGVAAATVATTSTDLGRSGFLFSAFLGPISTASNSATISAAEQRLYDGNPADAGLLARRALKVSPISAEAVRILGMAAVAQNNNEVAGAIFSQASALGWRDVPTQLWLAQAFVASGQYAAAAERMDAALRTNPHSELLRDMIDTYSTSERMAIQIAKRLAMKPSWREPFFAQVDQKSSSARQIIINEMVRQHIPIERSEILPTVNELAGRGDAKLARSLWASSQGLPISPLYDPDFERASADQSTPFEWTLPKVLGVEIETQKDSPKHFGLTIRTDGSATGVVARQLALLVDGPHQLTIDAHIAASEESSFEWTIRCIPSADVIFRQSYPARSTYKFTVPNSGCSAQSIELHVHSSSRTNNIVANYRRLYVN